MRNLQRRDARDASDADVRRCWRPDNDVWPDDNRRSNLIDHKHYRRSDDNTGSEGLHGNIRLVLVRSAMVARDV